MNVASSPVAEPIRDETQPPKKSRKRRRKARRWFGTLIFLAIVGGGGYAGWQYYNTSDAPAAVQYVTRAVEFGNIEDSISAIGTLSPSESRSVTVPFGGEIAAIPFEIGDVVAAGDVIASMKKDDLEASLRLARAQLSNLQASLNDRESQLRLQEGNLARQQGLLAAKAASEAAVQNAEAQVVSSRAQVESVRTQIVQQEQTLANAEADLAAADILAPIGGTVVSLTPQVGQAVNAGSPLMTLSDLSTMTVEAQVAEADVGRLKIGMPAHFTTLAGSNRRWEGTLRRILPTPEVQNDVVLYSVVFDVENPDAGLLIGMSTETFFVVASADNVLRVPVGALHPARLARSAGAPTGADTQTGQAPSGTPQFGGGNFTPPEGFDPSQFAGRATGNPPEGFSPTAGFTPPAGGFGQGQRNRGQGDDTGTAGTGLQRYSVQILKDDGTTEYRLVQVGIQDRVNAEIIAGLSEGEEIVVSTSSGATATTTRSGRGFGGQGGGGGLFGGPPLR